MSRGYGKYRRGGNSHSSFLFDNLFKENSNRPSAARSAATVGKWGITSFTSIRTMNGMSRSENEKSSTSAAPAAAVVPEPDTAPKPKKFFKSRNTEPPDLESSPTPPSGGGGGGAGGRHAAKRAKYAYDEKPSRGSSRKSQLVNDSDESETSPTPGASPARARSASTDSASATPRPANCRVTRSARRSMQQEPNGSPATADTPSEYPSLFASPQQRDDLSPQYIPAEKYELERKAMYETLLGSALPDDDDDDDDAGNQVDKRDGRLTGEEVVEDVGKCGDEVAAVLSDDVKLGGADRLLGVVESGPPVDAVNTSSEYGGEMDVEETIENIEAEINLQVRGDVGNPPPSTTVAPPPPPPEPPAAADAPGLYPGGDDWSTDGENGDSDTKDPEPDDDSRLAENQVLPHNIDDHRDQILDKILEPAAAAAAAPEAEPAEQAPVKLVISKKKGSIFKSRAVDGGSTTKKGRALYKHKWSDTPEQQQRPADGSGGADDRNSSPGAAGGGGGKADDAGNDFDFCDDPLERVTRGADNEDEDVTSVKCTRSDKLFYTVVRNVKKAHQMQEIGEFQEFNDDVEYILDALQDNNPISTRCLSAISLATKCMAPAFRMHVRAHGTVGKFFKALHDATRDQSLGLCTATVMFVLSQDRLNMDLDRDCLELMLNLLESDVSYQQALDECGLSSGQLEKNKQRVRELCADIQSQGHAMHLNLDAITVGQLAMETLLSLTSKRAGEWFKEELRELGGLEHIMKTISECCRQVSDYVVEWTDALLDKLRKVDRCLRVLENVTTNNEENQQYILGYENGSILDTLVNLYKLCDAEIPLYPVTDIKDKTSTGTIIREALLVTLKVLINLTHHFNSKSQGGMLIGLRPGIVDTSLHLLLQVPHYIPEQKKFELGVLVLMLLINLVQDQDNNKKLLVEAKAPSKSESIYSSSEESAVEALIVQFYHWEGCAKIAEKKTNAILDGEKDGDHPHQPKSNEEFIEETVAKLLQKAGTHMEYTFLASYIVMLLGFLLMDNAHYEGLVRSHLKGTNFNDMVELLKKFYNFMNLTTTTEASSVCAIKATQKVLKYLEQCDRPQDESKSEGFLPSSTAAAASAECMDLSYRMTQSQ